MAEISQKDSYIIILSYRSISIQLVVISHNEQLREKPNKRFLHIVFNYMSNEKDTS